MLNKEVKVILDLVRRLATGARSKIALIIVGTLVVGLFVSIPTTANAAACNPTTTTAGSKTVVTFTTVGSCDWSVPVGVASVWVVAVGGGGASSLGVSNQWWGAGGGGGQVTSRTILVNGTSDIAVVVGAGGTTGDGSASSFATVAANGGKTPTNTTAAGGVSGSGLAGGTGVTNTTTGGGGGGAWLAGSGINPGQGVSSSITGTAIEYGGGGNGYNGGTTTGTARVGAGSLGVEALANRGGGGALLSNTGIRGAGGSGVVIIQYTTPANCSPTITTIGSDTLVTFFSTGSCFWEVPTGVTAAHVLVVGGGGSASAGIGSVYWPAGGGGGQVVSNLALAVTPNSQITVNVGAGGAATASSSGASGNDGWPSVFGSITASGGLTNINSQTLGAVGGVSGSGKSGGTGSGSYGAGGGGGSGANGSGINGGAGTSSNITGTTVEYGGGGAGGNGASGSATGGGAVGYYSGTSSTSTGNGTDNTGGGGARNTTGYGGAGGSGVVIIRYSQPAGASVLSFEANGGTGSKASYFVTTSNSTTVPNSTGFTNEGYEFNGWNTAANGNGNSYAVGSSITLSASTTLYAQWLRVPSPSCVAGVGKGGPGTSNYLTTKAGNGCVGIRYKVSGTTTVATFNYTGSDQSWTVPSGVNSATFFLIGAGGGGGIQAGGGGGYATGTYSVTAGQVLLVIVGEGGGGAVGAAVSGLPGKYTPLTYGGGGRGGSYGGAASDWYASGGGRSAIRLPGATTDLVTAAGGGGGSYGQCGFGGGGENGLPLTTAGNSGTGGTQTAGGTGGISTNNYPGTAGTAYLGGNSKDEGGGGGGGYFGGGGGGDNAGGPGGSSYIALLSNALTNPGGNCGAAAIATGLIYVVTYDANGASGGTVPGKSTVGMTGGSLTLATNTGTLVKNGYTFAGWNTAANGSGTNYAGGATTFAPSGDTTLYASWSSTITFNGNGNTSAVSTVPATITTTSTQANVTLPAVGTLLRTNFTFAGWNTQADGRGTNYASGTTTYQPIGNTTLYAQWKTSITFNGNTNSTGSAPAIIDAITSTITLPSNTGNLVKTGYVFSGWNTAANGSGTTYAIGASYPIVAPTTLYAYWLPSNSGLIPNFNTDTSAPIGVVASTGYVINNVYTNNVNDLVLSDYAEKVQIIAIVAAGTVAITTTTNLTLPIGYQAALNTAATTISFVGNLADVNAALASLKYTAPATAVPTTIYIYAAYAGFNGDYRYNPVTGSSYWRGATTASWADAYNPTAASSNCGVSFNGMCGYLAVPNDAAESQLIPSILGLGWIGITDSVQGAFKYVANAPNGNATAAFTYFASGYGTNAAAQYAAIAYANGYWLERSTELQNPIYEFGGKSETPIFAPLTRTIVIGALTTPTAPTLDTASDTGASSTDKKTKDNTPTINVGGLTVGATITLTATPASGTPVTCSFVATSTTGSCTFSTLTDGTYSITAKQSLGGTTTVDSTALASVVIDATAPTVTLTSAQVVSGGNLTATVGIPAVSATITVTFSESVTDLTIAEIIKNIESTGWAITTTSFTTAAITTINFVATNSTGAGGTAGIARFSVGANSAYDVAGNGNSATASDFIINTLIQLSLTNEYQQSPLLNPVVGGNNAFISQTSPGQTLTLPGAGTLTRTGYTFVGWSLETTNGSGPVIGATITPTIPVKLYSSWTPNVYVVTYNANGGNGAPTNATQSYSYGSAALALTTKGTLSRTGYTFAGWNTLATGLGTNYLESASYTPTASITLYAKWTAGTYAVTFNTNTGSGTAMTNLSITAGTSATLTANTYTKIGYTFAGWNTAADGTGNSYMNGASVTLYGNTTLYAQWAVVAPGAPSVTATTAGNTIATVTVTGVAASGTTIGPATSFSVQAYLSDGTTVVTGKTCTVLASASPLSCEISGLTNGTTYKFIATAINTAGSKAGLISTVTVIPTPYVVTYSPNGGSVTPTTANYNLGTPVVLPLPTKTGNTFAGWNNPSNTSVGIDGSSYSPTASITLTAQWTTSTYTITYNGNGSDGGSVPAAGSFTYGNNYSIASKGTMTKSGYSFSGWTTSANGSGTLYANAADSVATSTATYSTAANLTVYAKWTPQVYVITYNANGASGSPSRATDSYTFGTTAISLPNSSGMTYANYTFGGWSETTNGVAVVDPYSPTQTRTLYALWTGVQYSITYNANGGTVNSAIPDATYTTGTTGITLNNGSTLSRTGYTFGGWKDAEGTTVSGSPYIATSNVTLYAIWTPKTIVVTYDKGIATTTPTVFPASPVNSTFGANFTLGNSDTSTVTSTGNFAFAGWKIGADTYKSGDSYRITGENPVTITAQWIQLFEVTYNANGGAFATGEGINDSECGASKLCAVNAPITLNKTPTRTGFTFVGWVSQAGVSYSQAAATTVTETNYIFYATWTANTYTITFGAGLGSNGNATAITDSHGAIVQLPANTGYSLSGSIFTGWLIGSTTYAAGALYTMGTDASPITATAQYANNTFKIFYNTNGATGGSTPAATTAAQGAAVNLDAATGFSRAGYTFEGWSDGTNLRAASYSTTMGSTNSTYIAQWKIAAPVAPTVSSVIGADGGATIAVAAGTGGGAPASYLVTASPDGATCTVYAPATTCSISPLTNGTAYTFAVTATNSTGTSAATTSSSVTPAGTPSAPTGVNAVRGNTTATVSLNAVTGSNTGGPAITAYTITAYDSSNNAVGTPCTATGGATSCVVTGLTNGTAYTFKATASNGLFSSSASTASAAVIPATVPSTPTSVTAAVTASGQATISFTAPTNDGGAAITGYTITSSPGGFTCTAAASATSCVVSGLTNGTAYTFTALATNEIGNSVASTVTSSVTPQGAASAPTTVSAAVGDGQSVVTFSGAVTNGSTITNYTVKAYDSTGNVVATVTCSTSPCTVTGLTNGSAYTFRVETNSTVYGTATVSAPSVATNSITPATVPSAPTGVSATAGTNKITVAWSEPSANGSPITSYTVQAYDSTGTTPVVGATCTATAPSTTCDVSSSLVAGTNYTFKVTATSAAGTSSASTASPSAAMNSAPSVPLSVTATAGNSSATVSWSAPANINGSAITSYTITAYTAGNVASGTCTAVAPSETCTVTGLTNGTAYTFKATATNGIGTSAQSTASSAVTPSTVPTPPTGLTVASGDGLVTISFTAPTNDGGSPVTGYTVTASNGATISGSSSPLTIAGLTNGTAYTFTVKATNINGDSVASVTSASSTPVASSRPTLVNPGQPTGDPYVGSTLTSNVTFNGSPTPVITYQWKVCTDPLDLSTCTNISGATSATFTPTISELGKYIVVAATATNRVGTLTETSVPTLVINPEIAFTAPGSVPAGTVGSAYVLSLAAAGGVGSFGYTVSSGTLPAGLTLNPTTGQISGTPTTAGTYTFTVRAADSNGVYKDVVVTIVVAAATTTPVATTPVVTPPTEPPAPTCDSACQASKDAAATKAAADKAAADAAAKAAADAKIAADAAAAKAAANTAATNASTKAAADAAAAAAAAKAAVDKAAAAAIAQAAADAAAKAAAAQAKAAADAQAAAAKAAADAAAALKNSTTTAAAKAAATASSNAAAAAAAAAVKAAATAAQQAVVAKTTAANATKQVDIAINSLTSKTAASQASAQANAIAAAAKAAANDAAAAAAAKAAEAKVAATTAQKAAAETAARIATEQKQAADAAAQAKIAADAAAKATADKVAADAAATKAAQDLAKVLADKAALADAAAKATDETTRAEIQKKIDEVSTKVEEVQKSVEVATTKAEAATTVQVAATQSAESATKEAQTQAAEAVAVKTESVAKTAEATKAVAAATVAAKVAVAAKEAADKVPAKATIIPKPNTSTSKNSATATVTGLKPGQKVKVTVNVKDK